ncbi:MAG TPA: hypothetical protein VKD66_16285, partial [Streptosporangiaceae bacterium]|nr:hypothetical protein [Streptosporangiaceae bacterium]
MNAIEKRFRAVYAGYERGEIVGDVASLLDEVDRLTAALAAAEAQIAAMTDYVEKATGERWSFGEFMSGVRDYLEPSDAEFLRREFRRQVLSRMEANDALAAAEKRADDAEACIAGAYEEHAAAEAKAARYRAALERARPFVLLSGARMQDAGLEPRGAGEVLALIDAALADAPGDRG